MKFKFKGLDGQDEMTLRGVVFAKDKAIEVEDGEFAERLKRLDYFVIARTRKPNNDKISG